MKKIVILNAIIALFATLFTYTSISKLIYFSDFRDKISMLSFPKPLESLITWTTPIAELITVILLILPRWRLKGLYLTLMSMVIFTGYIITVSIFMHELPCSCGGILEQLSWPNHIILNSLLVILAIFGIILEKQLIKHEKDELENYIKFKHP